MLDEIVVSFIESGCKSEDGYFYYPLSEDEKMALPLQRIEEHTIYKEYEELLQTLSRIRMCHHTPYSGKTWIFFDGILTNVEDRRYAISITNTNEYAVHVYKKSTNKYMYFVLWQLSR